MCFAPLFFRRVTAATAVWPVASIGSTTITSRSGHDRVAEILDRFERLRVAIEPDMSDARARNEIENALHQPVAGAQNRDEAEFLALDGRRVVTRQRRLDRFVAIGKSRVTS